MERELGEKVDLDEVSKILKQKIAEQFGFTYSVL
jgi:hypothetical protein